SNNSTVNVIRSPLPPPELELPDDGLSSPLLSFGEPVFVPQAVSTRAAVIMMDTRMSQDVRKWFRMFLPPFTMFIYSSSSTCRLRQAEEQLSTFHGSDEHAGNKITLQPWVNEQNRHGGEHNARSL